MKMAKKKDKNWPKKKAKKGKNWQKNKHWQY